MKTRGNDFFWPSFTDLLMSLFFIMLVLYVLTFIMLKRQQIATEQQIKKIKEIQAAVKELPQEYFSYQQDHKRFSLNTQIQFITGKSDIDSTYKDYLLKVGKSIEDLIVKLKTKYSGEDIKYLIVIEGMASKDGYIYNDELSYQRALSLSRFWKTNNIIFDPNICEVQIAGSGIGGVGRYASNQEYKNQRFLIQVVPKIGEID